MRFIGGMGILVAALGLIGGPIGYFAASTVFQQIVGGMGTITGMLGLIAAALGLGIADLKDAARRQEQRLETLIVHGTGRGQTASRIPTFALQGEKRGCD